MYGLGVSQEFVGVLGKRQVQSIELILLIRERLGIFLDVFVRLVTESEQASAWLMVLHDREMCGNRLFLKHSVKNNKSQRLFKPTFFNYLQNPSFKFSYSKYAFYFINNRFFV